jgi:hypothetical protein
MQGMIDMALLLIEESTKSIQRIISTTVVISCIYAVHKQTNTSARWEGRWVQKKMLGRYDERDRNIFTHVEVTRQEHRGQHWHVPLSEVDILID